MSNFDNLKLSVEALSGGKNTVILDDVGMPSIFVVIPKFNIVDVIDGGSAGAHQGFVVGGVEKNNINISKYQNIVVDNRAYSLPFKDPRASLTFDQAKTFCENKGAGFHLMTNAEWAAVALWCKKNGFMPRGNNNFGASVGAVHEKGVQTSTSSGQVNRVATGSGPVAWAHNNSNDGIFDLNGNVNEWVGGLRLVAGEIQIIADNNAANPVDQSSTSTLWKAILENGTLVEPGTADTLKWDFVASKITLAKTITTQSDTSRSNTFQTNSAGTVTPPEILRVLGLHPIDGSHGDDNIFMNNGDGLERLPLRGGNWTSASGAGVFYLDLRNPRSLSASLLGFRSAYVS
jgi:hypothetical protein